MRYDLPRKLTAAQQYVLLRSNPNTPGAGTLAPGRLSWRCVVRPMPLSRDYHLRVDYKADGLPEMFVESPDLTALADGKRIPHLYKREHPVELCLFMARRGDWNASRSIAEQVLPWAVTWLFYFEDWLATGEWKGGGEHPALRPASGKERKRRLRETRS